MSENALYGMIAEFGSESELLKAAEKMRECGYSRCDFFSPFPIDGLDEALGRGRSVLGKIVFAGGLLGFLTALAMEMIPASWLYPLMVAGRKGSLAIAPTFLPIMFEMTILFGAFAALIGMLILNGLPRWNHPLFEWDEFRRASDDGFFVIIEAADPRFSEPVIREFFTSLGARHITEVRE